MNYVKKHWAKFQNDWSSRFLVMVGTDFKNEKSQKNTKVLHTDVFNIKFDNFFLYSHRVLDARSVEQKASIKII